MGRTNEGYMYLLSFKCKNTNRCKGKAVSAEMTLSFAGIRLCQTDVLHQPGTRKDRVRDQQDQPYFISRDWTYKAKLGTAVSFHCEVRSNRSNWSLDKRVDQYLVIKHSTCTPALMTSFVGSQTYCFYKIY